MLYWRCSRLMRMVFASASMEPVTEPPLTGIVFCFVLAPVLGAHAWSLPNVLTHVAVPLAAVADFFVAGAYGRVRHQSD